MANPTAVCAAWRPSAGQLAPDYYPKPRRVGLRVEGGSDLRLDAVLTQQRGDLRRVNEHVLMVLAITTPGAIGVRQEGGDVTDEAVGGRHGELGDDRPVLADLGKLRGLPPGTAIIKIAYIKREQTTGTQRPGDRDQRLVNGPSIRQVVERVTDGHNCIRPRQRVIRKRELTHFLGPVAKQLAGDVQHRQGRVTRDDAMPRSDKLLSEKPRPAPEFEHQALLGAQRRKQTQYPRSARGSMEPKTAMMHNC